MAELIGDYVGKAPLFEYRSIPEIGRVMNPFYPDTYSSLKADKGTSWVFDNSKLLSLVPDFKPEISLEEGIKNTLEAFKARGDTGTDERWSELCDQIIAGKGIL